MIVDAGTIQPSTYNPRTADPRRLEIIELSLRKLAWLLPLYVADGEILSGHQRHHVATERVGVRRVPVRNLGAMQLAHRKAVNITFNRGTNDLASHDTPRSLTEAIERSNVYELAAALPDRDLDAEDSFRCEHTERVPVRDFLQANAGRWIDHAANVSRSLAQHDVRMPVIATRDLGIVNGLGRVQYASASGDDTIETVWLEDRERAVAHAFLNLLSMDFDIHTRYADDLRYNSFRRARDKRYGLGIGFLFDLVGKSARSNAFDIADPVQARAWKAHYGNRVLDFGAGLLIESGMLNAAGVDCVPFEPFVTVGSSVSTTESRKVARAFLERVPTAEFDSVFLASIMNSVPFAADRAHIVTLVASLCSPRTRLFACAASTKQAAFQGVSGKQYVNETDSTKMHFRLDYEPNITIGDFGGGVPKVQRYFTERQWFDLWSERFGKVKTSAGVSNMVAVVASNPKPIPWPELERAIRFEFDLPHPGGERLGLADDAVAAWKRRIG